MRTHPVVVDAGPLATPERRPRARSFAAWLADALFTPRTGPRVDPLTITLREADVAGFHVRRAGLVVRCLEGCLWVTHEADPGDHILAPGQQFVASTPGHLVVFALASSRAVVSGAGVIRR